MEAPRELQVAQLTQHEVQALKALHAGEADAYQQRLALQVMVNKFSRAQDLLYIPGDTHATAFLNGRAFVGATVLKHLKLPVGALINNEGNDDVQSEAPTSRR